jgi:hypothetical protein
MLGTVAATVPIHAHHSFAAHYFEERSVSVEGEVVMFEYRNPHAWVHVMAKDQTGEMQRFSAEWNSVGRLRQSGIREDTIKPGDHVIITGAPGREPTDRKLHLKSIQRPMDGWSWSRGSTR